jgi:hypothetical protein
MALLILLAALAGADAKATLRAPYRGWTSWDLSAVTGAEAQGYGREFLTEAAVVVQSDALAASPLQAAWGVDAPGRVTVAIDSFWAADPTQVTDAAGRWTHNTTRFPNGMAAVAAHVHANGQLFGIYLNPGVAVNAVKAAKPIEGCAATAADIAVFPRTGGNTFGDCYAINWSNPCAQAYIDSEARQLAMWGVDFLKLDAVSPGSDVSPAPPAPGAIDNRPDIAAWSSALEASGRDIWLTISWRIDPAFAEDFAPHANAWRTSDDIDCYCATLSVWHSLRHRFMDVVPWLPWLSQGRPDLDSLNLAAGVFDGLTNDEKVTSATLWSLTGGPWYTGNDLTVADGTGSMLLGNSEVLAINALGAQPVLTPASANGTADLQVWAAPAAAAYGPGAMVVALFNVGDASANVTADFTQLAVLLGLPVTAGSMNVRDLWLRADLGPRSASFSAHISSHGARYVLLQGGVARVAPPVPCGSGSTVSVLTLPASALTPDAVYDASSGRLHIVWGTAGKDAMYAYADEGAGPLSTPVQLNTGGVSVTTTMGERGPKIAQGKGGALVVVWADLWAPGVQTLARSVRSPDGGTWSRPVQVTPDAFFGTDGLSVAADPVSGLTVVTYHVNTTVPTNASSATWLYSQSSVDLGATWAPPVLFQPTNLPAVACSMCMTRARFTGADSTLHVAYRSAVANVRDFYVLSGRAGSAFTASRVNDADWLIDYCPMNGPELSIAQDAGGAEVVAFMTGDANNVFWSRMAADGSFNGPVGTPRREDNERYATAVASADGADVLMVWQVGPMAVSGTASVKYACYNGATGTPTAGQGGTLGTSFAGTKATALLTAASSFVILTTAS